MELCMNTLELSTFNLANSVANEKEEEFSIPLDISDILNICQEYNQLGWKIQNQIQSIVEIGLEESIKLGYIKIESLPYIKHFLKSISNNPYFGDAVDQAHECIFKIKEYEEKKIHSCMN